MDRVLEKNSGSGRVSGTHWALLGTEGGTSPKEIKVREQRFFSSPDFYTYRFNICVSTCFFARFKCRIIYWQSGLRKGSSTKKYWNRSALVKNSNHNISASYIRMARDKMFLHQMLFHVSNLDDWHSSKPRISYCCAQPTMFTERHTGYVLIMDLGYSTFQNVKKVQISTELLLLIYWTIFRQVSLSPTPVSP